MPDIKKGDRYTWHSLEIEVLRVSEKWADIRVLAGESSQWTKRQKLPFPKTFVKVDQ